MLMYLMLAFGLVSLSNGLMGYLVGYLMGYLMLKPSL